MMCPLSRWLITDDQATLTSAQRATHTYAIGQPGTGKSRALESWVMQDVAAGHGAAVIDPHGDLFHNLICRLTTRPDAWRRVVIIDPCDANWVTVFNPLEAIAGLPVERLALFLTDVHIKIWKVDATKAPRMVWLMTHAFVALSSLGLTLVDLPRLLLDAKYRNGLLPRLAHEATRAYFTHEFPKHPVAVNLWVAPVLNKIGGLVFDPDIRLLVAGRSTVNFRQVLDEGLILLAHLPKGIIGEAPSALLGAFLVAQLQKAALSRADTGKRQPYYLYLDEFQNYTTDNISDVLSESRKYGLSLTLAHQYLDQLSPQLRSAVLNTTGTLCCFRVGYDDADKLAKELFPAREFLSTRRTGLKIRQLLPAPSLAFDEREEALGWDRLAQELVQLPAREFWVKRRGQRDPVRLRTLEVPDPEWTPELEMAVMCLRAAAGKRFGRWKPDVAQEVDQHIASAGQPDSTDGTIPMWGT